MTILYIITSILWGLFAVKVNAAVNDDARFVHHIFCFILNTILCPITIIIALCE